MLSRRTKCTRIFFAPLPNSSYKHKNWICTRKRTDIRLKRSFRHTPYYFVALAGAANASGPYSTWSVTWTVITQDKQTHAARVVLTRLRNLQQLWMWRSCLLECYVVQFGRKYYRFGGTYCPDLYSEKGGSNIIRNVGNFLPDYTEKTNYYFFKYIISVHKETVSI
jgi:hypothetical protein